MHGGAGAVNRREHLLTCLGEECVEAAQRVSKALRFGVSEIQPGQDLSNSERLELELRDLFAVACILRREKVLGRFMPTVEEVDAKEARILKFMAIAREQGVLS